MQSNPVSYAVAPVRPEQPAQPVVSQPATVEPTVRDRMERAAASIKDAAHEVAEGLRKPVEELKQNVRGGVVAGAQQFDQPYLNLLNKYETVFVIDDSSTLSKSDWERTKAALFQMAPLALLHNAAGGVTVYHASGEGVLLRTKEDVGNHVLSQMQQSAGAADVSDLVRRTLADRLGKMGDAGFHPLNLVVVSNRAPDAAAQQALKEAAESVQGAKAKHPLRVGYSITRDDPRSVGDAKAFADTFAIENKVEPIFDAGTIPYGPAFDQLAVQQLVGKIGTWSIDSAPI